MSRKEHRFEIFLLLTLNLLYILCRVYTLDGTTLTFLKTLCD